MSKTVLITGMDGFIGHHLTEHLLKNTDWNLVGLTKIDCASTLHRLQDIEDWSTHSKRVTMVYHDLRAPVNEYVRKRLGNIDIILHLAASTHVDRSIECPMEFVLDNVVGTCNILDYARGLEVRPVFLYFSTDEVFGPALGETSYKEWDRYKSGNPYAATKAGGGELAQSYHNTYGLPLITTYTMNVMGERQHPEKFIPKVIKSVLHHEIVPIHSNFERDQAGSRAYIHARNVAAAILFLLKNVKVYGEKFNIVGEEEIDNLALAQTIATIVGNPLRYEMVDFHSSRPGHDLRYMLNGDKLQALGFSYPKSFKKSLQKTVEWFLEHQEWLL